MARILFALMLFASSAVYAQNSVTPGGMTSIGCPAGVTPPCWLPNSATNPLNVTTTGGTPTTPTVTQPIPNNVTSTNFAGAITTGGTWQQVAPTHATRLRFLVQNYCSATTQGISATESLFLVLSATTPTFVPTATPGAAEITACGIYDTSPIVVGTGPIWVWGATTGHRFDALEW
jgi:hypothetical protein